MEYCKSECHLSESCNNHIKNNKDKKKKQLISLLQDYVDARLIIMIMRR